MTSESNWVVTLTDTGVSCTGPNGQVESVAWKDLNVVTIVTDDLGPFSPDVVWVLSGERSECAIPVGAAGEDALLSKLQELPGFDNEVFIEAMSSTANNRFICWKRSAGQG